MLKTTFEQYYINFSNSDFSLDIASISAKFLGYVLHSPPEVLVICLCYVEISEKYLFTIIYVLCHKN